MSNERIERLSKAIKLLKTTKNKLIDLGIEVYEGDIQEIIDALEYDLDVEESVLGDYNE